MIRFPVLLFIGMLQQMKERNIYEKEDNKDHNNSADHNCIYWGGSIFDNRILK